LRKIGISTDLEVKQPFEKVGFHNATVTRAGVDDFMRRFPGCNWGAWFPGQFIIDKDVKNGAKGNESLERLENLLGKIPQTRTQKTPSGGLHYIMRQPAGYDIPKADPISKDYPGVDLQANLCYILLPPSVTDAGKYETIDNSPIVDAPIAWCEFALQAKTNNRKTESHIKLLQMLSDPLKDTNSEYKAGFLEGVRLVNVFYCQLLDKSDDRVRTMQVGKGIEAIIEMLRSGLDE